MSGFESNLVSSVSDPLVKLSTQTLKPLSCLCGNGNDRLIGKTGAEVGKIFTGPLKVHFVGHHQPIEFSHILVVELDLLAQNFKILNGVSHLTARHVDNEQQQLASRDVTEELMAKSAVVMSPLDEPGNIGNRAASVIGELHHSYHGVECRKRVIADFWGGVGELVDQG